MKKTIINLGAALAMGVASFAAISTPAMARDHYRGGYNGYDNQYRGGDYNRGYRGDYNRGGYRGNDGYYRGGSYRYNGNRCRDNGTGGTIIGAIAGGLLGNSVAGRGDRTTGAILGAGVGALAGRAIDKSDGRRC